MYIRYKNTKRNDWKIFSRLIKTNMLKLLYGGFGYGTK